MRIKVMNFGPISGGYSKNQGFMEIPKFTVFLGAQGSGKSTIIKLISTFSWIEKAFIADKIKPASLTQNKIIQEYLSWHNLEHFVKPETEVVFEGERFRISFFGDKKRKTKIERANLNEGAFIRPKICYIPAERNFCSSVPKVESVTGVVKNLSAIIYDFSESSEILAGTEIQLPLKKFSYKYSPTTKKKNIITSNGDSIELHEAASGIQSIVPLVVVNGVYSNPQKVFSKKSISPISALQKKKLENHIFNTLSDLKVNSIFEVLWHLENEPDYDFLKAVILHLGYKEPKSAAIKIESLKNETFRKQSVYLKNCIHETVKSCLLSIVEEPEQNLYPNSQKLIIENLIKDANFNESNKLVITTHSPYILGSINNCLYAGHLKNRGKKIPSQFNEIAISPETLASYFIEDGKIISANEKEMELEQINHSIIDKCSQDINESFDVLSDLEYSE